MKIPGVSMSLFVGLNVSQRLTHLCVVDAYGKRVWRGKCATDPTILAQTILVQTGSDARVGIETGPLTPWLVHALRAASLAVICVEARHGLICPKNPRTHAREGVTLNHGPASGKYFTFLTLRQ